MRRAPLIFVVVLAACASTRAQVSALPPDQRSYFEAIRAADPSRSDAAVLRTVRASHVLAPADRDAVAAAAARVAAVAPHPIDADAVQIEVAFDGTWDDRDEMKFETNPALLDALFDGPKHYETGVGTTTATRILGGIAGAGIHNRIDHAYAWLVDEIARHEPTAKIAVIVAGFSRGATAARAFANVLNQRGVPGREHPRIAAMILFDTVGSVGVPGTDLNPGLDLDIPANAQNVLHLTARDEKREVFPLSSATDPARPDDARITEVALPGVHSDIGGSYPNPYSRIALAIAVDYLRGAGAHVRPVQDVPDVNDPALRLHDTGGSSPRTIYPSKNP